MLCGAGFCPPTVCIVTQYLSLSVLSSYPASNSRKHYVVLETWRFSCLYTCHNKGSQHRHRQSICLHLHLRIIPAWTESTRREAWADCFTSLVLYPFHRVASSTISIPAGLSWWPWQTKISWKVTDRQHSDDGYVLFISFFFGLFYLSFVDIYMFSNRDELLPS